MLFKRCCFMFIPAVVHLNDHLCGAYCRFNQHQRQTMSTRLVEMAFTSVHCHFNWTRVSPLYSMSSALYPCISFYSLSPPFSPSSEPSSIRFILRKMFGTCTLLFGANVQKTRTKIVEKFSSAFVRNDKMLCVVVFFTSHFLCWFCVCHLIPHIRTYISTYPYDMWLLATGLIILLLPMEIQ